MSEIYIGLMSGTSLDGVDGVLADFSGGSLKVLRHVCAPFAAPLRDEFMALNTSGADEIHRAALAANALARVYGHVVNTLLSQSGLNPGEIQAIGAHGQTVRHRPLAFDGTGYTSQINNPALLAELTGIDVVADFRSRDLAAAGQGAPLVPAFHREVFGQANEDVAVLNIGGISNLTLIPAQSGAAADGVSGFDCGPGNALMDYWCQKHTGQAYDDEGQWAASGNINTALLSALLSEPYFGKTPPKSTGRDLFSFAWLERQLVAFTGVSARDVQATLAELTIRPCCDCVVSYQNRSKQLVVCGGGALNLHLMRRLQTCLPELEVKSSEALGLPPLQVEAAAFAWLARKAVRRETGSLPKVTGAQGARILGGIYPAV
jgi:anhydro-N-acetylmuramic acid kinase